jgi:ADP-ribose pyrophosphatase YjhB (NUDIX family)
MKNNNIEIRVRAIIQKDDKILVCYHTKDETKKNYYFLPGGHVEFGELAKEAMIRELEEELVVSIKEVSFIGSSENIFNQGDAHHEINLVFSVIVDKVEEKSKEDHIGFKFLTRGEFLKENVLPISLKEAVVKWIKNEELFFKSEYYR